MRGARSTGACRRDRSRRNSDTGPPRGAFARVVIGIEGLIHFSEMASRRSASPAEVVQPGDLVRVRVVAIGAEDGGCRCRCRKRQEMSCTQLGQGKMRTYNRNQMLYSAIYL